jgi:CBS domain containing-hemolysin-like protein
MLKQRNKKNVRYLERLKENMDRTLVALLVGNNVVNIMLSALAALLANSIFRVAGVSIAIGVLTFFIIIFGEITPKSNAVMHSMDVSCSHARVLYYFSWVLGPLITVFIFLSEHLIRLSGGRVRKHSLFVSDESIKSLASLGEEQGVIKPIERDIIHKVFTFGDLRIEQIMLPISQVFSVPHTATVAEAKELIAKRGYTRVPVFYDTTIIGVIYSKDLLLEEKGTVVSAMRKPFFVPASSEATHVFNAMKKNRVHMAIVTDDENRHIGIVTLEDILEELVGNIRDEFFELHG